MKPTKETRRFTRKQMSTHDFAGWFERWQADHPMVRGITVTIDVDREHTSRYLSGFTNRVWDQRIMTISPKKAARRIRYYTQRGFRLERTEKYGKDLLELWFVKVIETGDKP